MRNDAAVLAAGWCVIRVWECEVRRDTAAAAERVAGIALSFPLIADS
jgi:DNA mismatch endonuclease, patch repair protein